MLGCAQHNGGSFGGRLSFLRVVDTQVRVESEVGDVWRAPSHPPKKSNGHPIFEVGVTFASDRQKPHLLALSLAPSIPDSICLLLFFGQKTRVQSQPQFLSAGPIRNSPCK